MAFSLVHIKVADFAEWKPIFESAAPMRAKAGVEKKQILQHIDDRNDVTILFQVSDVAKAKALFSSAEVREVMQKAGVIGKPEVTYFS